MTIAEAHHAPLAVLRQMEVWLDALDRVAERKRRMRIVEEALRGPHR